LVAELFVKTSRLPTFFVVFLLFAAFFTQSLGLAGANPIAPPLPAITIGSDGSVNPATAPVNKTGNLYTLTEDLIDYRLDIQCSNIIFDGAGHILQGKVYTGDSGITIQADGVTIKNTDVHGYDVHGINARGSWNLITRNNITGNIVLVGSFNNITGNIISSANIYLGEQATRSSHNMVVGNTLVHSCVVIAASYSSVYLNNFINNSANTFWFDLPSEGGVFDNGSASNYWNDYAGIDANGDGIGDTPYVARVSATEYQRFNYPLMKPVDIAKVLDPYPPAISVVSPQNTTYYGGNVSLTFAADEPTSWMGYSIDGQDNVTVTENITITSLPYGPHNVTVYATDVNGNTGSETITFSIGPEPFPTALVIVSIVSVAVIGAGLLVYLVKGRKTTKINKP
jgi:hypothetical protein